MDINIEEYYRQYGPGILRQCRLLLYNTEEKALEAMLSVLARVLKEPRKAKKISIAELERLAGEICSILIARDKSLFKAAKENFNLKSLKKGNTDRQILKKYPPQKMLPEIERSLQHEILLTPPSFDWKRAFLGYLSRLIPIFTIGLVIFMLNPDNRKFLKKPEVEIISLKTPQLILKRTGREISIAYSAAGYKYGLIFSINQHLKIKLHYPYTQTDSAVLIKTNRNNLENAYQPASGSKSEIFVFISSDNPVSIEKILSMAGELKKQDYSEERIHEKFQGYVTITRRLHYY